MRNAETKLRNAAIDGNLEGVRKLVSEGVNVDATDDDGRTPLIHSARYGYLDVVHFLVERGAALEATDEDDWTPLKLSASEGHLDVVRYLVKRGAALEATDTFGRTSLIKSALEGYLDVVRYLVEQGAALDATDRYGRTSLMLSASEGHLDVVRYLVKRGAALEATDTFGWTPLILSAANGYLDVVRYLVEQGAALEVADSTGSTSLMLSASEGHLDVVRFLAERGAALDATDNDGWTPLMWSAENGHLDVVRYLVEQGANVSAVNVNGDTPFIYLLRHHHDNEDLLLPVVLRMLSNGASPMHRNKKEKSALDYAREKGFHQLEHLLYKLSRAESLSASEVKIDGTPISGNVKSAQTVAGAGQLPSSSDSCVDDAYSLWRHAKYDPKWNLVSNPFGIYRHTGTVQEYGTIWDLGPSSYCTYHDTGAVQAPLGMSSLLIPNLANDEEVSNANSLIAMLKSVAKRCKSVNEAAPLYQHVLSRLQTLVNTIGAVKFGDNSPTATLAEVRAISSRLNSLLDDYVNKPVVLRLVSVRAVINTLSNLHIELNRIETSHSSGKVHEWSSQWEEKIALMKKSIVARAEANLPTLVSELSSEKQQVEAMTLLLCELKHNKRLYSRIEQDVMHMALTRIMGFSKVLVTDVEEWFIPQHEVEIQSSDLLGRGSFGEVFRGVWRKSEVVVKCLTSSSDADKRAFFREVAVWHRIRHRNIVPFLGACHLASPYFMVCEFAPGGSLMDYLYRQRKNGKDLVWRKLHEVAVGLFYLHQEQIVHGDLKGDNIVVAKDGTAMLTDFGLSFVQSATVATLDNWGAIQWRAPEYVVQGGTGPSFAADVYSLAMVIVEAVTSQAPWGSMLDIAVTVCLRKKEMLKRPTNCAEMTDEAWDLVSRMSVYEPSERMPLNDVVDRLKELADDEEYREWQARAKSAGS